MLVYRSIQGRYIPRYHASNESWQYSAVALDVLIQQDSVYQIVFLSLSPVDMSDKEIDIEDGIEAWAKSSHAANFPASRRG